MQYLQSTFGVPTPFLIPSFSSAGTALTEVANDFFSTSTLPSAVFNTISHIFCDPILSLFSTSVTVSSPYFSLVPQSDNSVLEMKYLSLSSCPIHLS